MGPAMGPSGTRTGPGTGRMTSGPDPDPARRKRPENAHTAASAS